MRALVLSAVLILGACSPQEPVEPSREPTPTPSEPAPTATSTEVMAVDPVPCEGEVVPRSEPGNKSLDAVLESRVGLVACIVSIGSTPAPDYPGLEAGQEITEILITVENRTRTRITLPGEYSLNYMAFERSDDEPTFRLSGHGTPLPGAFETGEVVTGRYLFSNGPDDRGDQLLGWFDLSWWENPQR